MKKVNRRIPSQDYQTPSSFFHSIYEDNSTNMNTSSFTSRPNNFESVSSKDLNSLFDQFKIKKLSHSNLLNIVEKETKQVQKIIKRPRTVYSKINFGKNSYKS